MLSPQRQKEMLEKIAGLNKVEKRETIRKPGIEGDKISLEMDVSVPQALVGMGIAISEEEGQKFLSGYIASSLAAMAMGLQNPGQAFHDFVKFGFILGVSATKGKEGN